MSKRREVVVVGVQSKRTVTARVQGEGLVICTATQANAIQFSRCSGRRSTDMRACVSVRGVPGPRRRQEPILRW